MKLIFKIILLQIVIGASFNGIVAQYKLSTEQLKDGLFYLKKNGGFKNPSSVKFNDASVSTFNFKKECFTWARYDISAQNGFGGYVRDNFFVYFFDGKPFMCMPEGDYPAYIYASNSDGAADYLLRLATIDYLGTPALPSSDCPGELEQKQKEIEIQNQIKENKLQEDKKNYGMIRELIKDNKVNEACLTYKKLNFPSSYPDINLLNQEIEKHDNSLLSKCEMSVQNGNYFEGIGFAEQMLKPENFTIKKSIWDQIPESTLVDLYKETSGEIKNKIKVYLSNYFNDKYKNVEENYPVEQTNRFIEDNKELLKKLSVGNHEVLIKRNGELFIDNQLSQERPNNYNANEFKYESIIMKKDFFSFDVLINGKMILIVTENNKLIDNSEKLILNSNKKILMKPNGVIYAANLLNTNPRHDEIGYYTPEKYKTINPSLKIDSLKKSEYVIVQKQKSTIFVNNKEVGQIDNEIITGEGKLSKRIPTIITRTTILTSGIFWGALRAIEYLRIP
jgi:hypothetical protein